MEIKNSNAVLRLHCNDSDGFTWIKSLNALCKILPGRITKRMSSAVESSEYSLVLFRKVMRDSAGKKWKTDFFDDRMEMTYLGRTYTPQIYPGYTHVVFVEAPVSATYGKRLRFMGCYELTGIAGKKFIFTLVSREFDMVPADEVKMAA